MENEILKKQAEEVQKLVPGSTVEQYPKNKVAVLFHNDLDGMGAAYAVHTHLKDTCELIYLPVQYSQDPPMDELRAFGPDEIMIVDFCYEPQVLRVLNEEFGEWVTVIDHHKTALAHLQEWDGKYVFDLHRSGAVLTWDSLNRVMEPAPELLLYIQDRDLWKFELEHSQEINAFIATLPFDFAAWDEFYLPEAYTSGKAILAFQGEQIRKRVEAAEMVPWGKYEGFGATADTLFRDHGLWDEQEIFEIPTVNCSENVSEVGHALCEAYPEAPFSVTYCDRPGGQRSFSLRSEGDFDVSEVAKAFGGGGHFSSAGFTLDSPSVF